MDNLATHHYDITTTVCPPTHRCRGPHSEQLSR